MDTKTEKIIVMDIGKRGSGKTHLAKKQVQGSRRLVIYDTLGHDYTDGVIFEDIESLKAFWVKVYRHNFRIIYRPLDPEGEFPQVAELVWGCGDLTFLVEECDRYCQPQRTSIEFKEIIGRGRHKDIELICATFRPRGIDHILTSQTKKMCIFNTNEPDDVKYLKSLIGDQIETKIAELKQFEYVEWLDGRDELMIKKESL